ncbi:MAG: FliM/FliN family flagellar motor switch protein [Alphaproteobacteria bacterium]|nr:FliM/FliN family flagellar motor switch protein [Alphaproteobacteria bacterium]
MGRLLPEMVATKLMLWNPVMPRVTLEGSREEEVQRQKGETMEFVLPFAAGSLEAIFSCDRTLIALLTDLLLGGTGTESVVTPNDRPLSRIEEDICELVFQSLSKDLPALISGSHGFKVADSGLPAERRVKSSPERDCFYMFRLLVNVFGYDGELRVGFHCGELRDLIAAASQPTDVSSVNGSERVALLERVHESPTEIIVTLEADALTVMQLSSLVPGYVLQLRSTVHTPVMVLSGGIPLFVGHLAKIGDRLAVRVAEQ